MERGLSSVVDEKILAGRRCLVMDDEFLIALDIQQILEAAGASVVCATNAADALAAMGEKFKFDLAVLDVQLAESADITSLDLARILAKQRMPFVFLTGMRRSDLHEMDFPDAPVVEKPYEAPLLLAAVVRALEAVPKPIRHYKMTPPASDAGDDNILS